MQFISHVFIIFEANRLIHYSVRTESIQTYRVNSRFHYNTLFDSRLLIMVPNITATAARAAGATKPASVSSKAYMTFLVENGDYAKVGVFSVGLIRLFIKILI